MNDKPNDSSGRTFEERRAAEELLRKRGNKRAYHEAGLGKPGQKKGKKKKGKKINAGTEQKVLAFPVPVK